MSLSFNPRETTVKTAPQNNDLIGRVRKNDRATLAARTLVQFFDV